MAKTTYKTRAKAAEHLNTLDPSKTMVQWHTFLNDNARTSVPEDADITVRYNFNAMQDDKDKVNTWLAHYKDGVNEFNSPISEVIQSQLKVYSSSCESLGGHLVN